MSFLSIAILQTTHLASLIDGFTKLADAFGLFACVVIHAILRYVESAFMSSDVPCSELT